MNNIAKQNIRLLERHPEWRKGDMRSWQGDIKLQCVDCSEYITEPVLRYFDYDPRRTLCYSCQNN